MKPMFKVDMDRLYISDKWLCNGHWLISRDAAKRETVLNRSGAKAVFKKLLTMRNGKIVCGDYVDEDIPDLETVIPARGDQSDLVFSGEAEFNESLTLMTFIYKGDSFKIGVAPEYAPLLQLGDKIKAKNTLSPIAVYDDGSLAAVIMPRRI